MKLQKMRSSDYESEFGPLRSRGVVSEDALKVWEQVKALPISEVLIIVEPEKNDGDAARLKGRLYASLSKLVGTANFKLCYIIRKHEKHLVIVKVAKNGSK